MDTEIAVDDLGVVMEKLWDARTKWYYIGVQFGITVSDLDVIEMEPKSDVTEMFRKMIMTWLKKGENCTWRTVYDALKHCTVEQQRIAENLKSWLVKGVQPRMLATSVAAQKKDPKHSAMKPSFHQLKLASADQAGILSQVCTLTLVGAGSQEFSQVQAYFENQWAKGACPPITYIFQVTNAELEKQWKAYQQKLPAGYQGNEEYFHGTNLSCNIANLCTTCKDLNCGICSISNYGMNRHCIKKNINFQRFGHAFYFTPHSSKCHDHTQGVHTHRAMLLCSILPGKKYNLQETDQRLTGPPNGCHSVYCHRGKSLHYPELLVYNPECVMPRYIIVYILNGVHKFL